MKTLTFKDIMALGFMTFALFVGAGNIIYPPLIGLQAGPHMAIAAIGFLITAVGLPVLTIIAIAKAGGAMASLSSPIGKTAGLILAIACYLIIGPFFATPRTTTVSYEIALAPLFGESSVALGIYSLIYFGIVILVSMYPDRLLDSVGRILAPIKIIAIAALGIAAYVYPVGMIGPAADKYIASPLTEGIVNGYLTMDTLGGLVFGIVIINAIRSRGITSPALLTRYAIIAGLIAGLGLVLIYISLFQLGAQSFDIAAHASNGAEILHSYVQHTFGSAGSIFLGILIWLACIVTAIGLTIACAEFFSTMTPLSYRTLVILFALLALVFSNLGLNKLTLVSIPILTAIYPPCIVLVVLSFFARQLPSRNVTIPAVMAVSFIFAVFDAISVAGWADLVPAFLQHLPLYTQNMGWITPAIIMLCITACIDRARLAQIKRAQAV